MRPTHEPKWEAELAEALQEKPSKNLENGILHDLTRHGLIKEQPNRYFIQDFVVHLSLAALAIFFAGYYYIDSPLAWPWPEWQAIKKVVTITTYQIQFMGWLASSLFSLSFWLAYSQYHWGNKAR